LIDKTPRKPEPKVEPEPEAKPTQAQPQPTSRLSGPKLSISEIDAIRQQFYQCWSVPIGARDAASLKVIVRIRLNPDGSLMASPELLNPDKLNGPNGNYFRVAVDSAFRAIHRCTPLKVPPQKYDAWREIELTFDPSDLLG